MKVIGLTGGICSGKSTVNRKLGELGVKTIDADKLGHRCYEKGTNALQQVVDAFPEHKLLTEDGEIDRRALGTIVFGSKADMKRLTDVVWPAIGELIQQQLAEEKKSNPEGVVCIEAAVLIEAGWQNLVDSVWVVQVPVSVAHSRLMARNNLSSEEATKRIQSQITNEERRAHADVVIDNSSSMEAVFAMVEAEFQKLTQPANL